MAPLSLSKISLLCHIVQCHVKDRHRKVPSMQAQGNKLMSKIAMPCDSETGSLARHIQTHQPGALELMVNLSDMLQQQVSSPCLPATAHSRQTSQLETRSPRKVSEVE